MIGITNVRDLGHRDPRPLHLADRSRPADVTAVTQRLTVEVTDRQADVAAGLVGAGVGARAVGPLLEVELVDDTTYDLVRDVVADLGIGLVLIGGGFVAATKWR